MDELDNFDSLLPSGAEYSAPKPNNNDDGQMRKKPTTTTKMTRKRRDPAEKLVIEEEKARKKLLKLEQKSMQPKEAMKFMQILLDVNISTTLDKRGTVIQTIRQSIDCPDFRILSDNRLSIDNLITWRRRNVNTSTSADSFTLEREHCLLITDQNQNLEDIVDKSKFIALLGRYRRETRLLPVDSKLHLIFYDFNLLNDQQLFEICISEPNVNYHKERDLKGVGEFLAKFTKSIAEKPYKQRKKDLETFLSFLPASDQYKNLLVKTPAGSDNKEEDNQSETRKFYWRKMLQVACGSKPNAENAAKVISTKFTTISSLQNAYRSLTSESQCETMLQHLIADPLSGVRVGPSISTCVYRVFMKMDETAPVDKPKP